MQPLTTEKNSPATQASSPAVLLLALQRKVYAARFEDARDMIDRIRPTDGPAWQCLESATPAETSKIRCLCATVYEYYGDDDNALSSIAEIGATAEIELGRLVSVRFAGFDADALKGHVSAGVHLSYSRYRRHDYDGASGLLTLCEKAVEHLGEAPLTRVRLMYTRALVHRRLHEYNHAKRNLADAMSLAMTSARDPAKRALATLMLVQCTTAMSWLAYSEGALNVALTSLLSAKAMAFLLSAGETPNESPQCRLIVEFMSVLQACFERARGSKDRSVLDRVIKALRHSYATFEVAGHSDYRARAANQLALAYLSLADLTGGNSTSFTLRSTRRSAITTKCEPSWVITTYASDALPRSTPAAFSVSGAGMRKPSPQPVKQSRLRQSERKPSVVLARLSRWAIASSHLGRRAKSTMRAKGPI